jgi:hypothetical protein
MSEFEPLTLYDLEKAGLAFEHRNDEAGYSKLVFAHFNDGPRDLAAAAVTFLDKWGAFHYSQRKLRIAALSSYLPDWFETTQETLKSIRISVIQAMTPDENASVYSLANSLYRGGVKPTEYGKLLHFVAPFGVALWDDKWVRTNYELAEGPREFMFYQRALQALIAELTRVEGERSIETLLANHHQQTGCEGGLPKLFDEAVYDDISRTKIARWISNHNPL